MNIRIQNRAIPVKTTLRFFRKSYKGVLGLFLGNVIRRFPSDRKIRAGFAVRPVVANVEITRNCNLRCKMCWLWGVNGVGRNGWKELSANQWIDTIENVAHLVSMVYFTGGEPLTKGDLLIRLIRLVKAKRRLCSITTNGTLINRSIAEKLIDSALDVITVSLDGDEKGHDTIRGAGSFQKTMKGIREIIAARKDKQVALPLIKTSTTITDVSPSSLESLIFRLKDMDIDICQLQYPWFLPEKRIRRHRKTMARIFDIDCQGIWGYANDSMDQVVPADIERLINQFQSVMNGRFALFPNVQGRDEIYKYFNDLGFGFRNDCQTPWTNVTLKSDGRVNLCPDYYIPEYAIGHVPNEEMGTLWNNMKARDFRKALTRHGPFPGCARCCGLFS